MLIGKFFLLWVVITYGTEIIGAIAGKNCVKSLHLILFGAASAGFIALQWLK